MYKIGDKVEVVTKLLTMDIIMETKVMTITNVYPYRSLFENNKICYRYSCDGNDYIHYPEKRIIRIINQ